MIETENDSALTSILDALSTFKIGCDGCHVASGIREEEAAGQGWENGDSSQGGHLHSDLKPQMNRMDGI